MEHGAIIVLGVILGVGSKGWRGFGFRAGRPEMPRLTQEVALMPGMSAADVGAGRGEVTVALAAEAGPSGWGFSSGGDEPRPLARPATGRRARHYRLPADVLLAMAVVVEGHPGSDRPRFAAIVKDRGRLCDLGCGPGQIVRYFTECVRDRRLGVDGGDGASSQPGAAVPPGRFLSLAARRRQARGRGGVLLPPPLRARRAPSGRRRDPSRADAGRPIPHRHTRWRRRGRSR